MSSLWKRVAVRQATVAHLRSRGTFRSECNFRPSLLVVQTHSTYSKRTGKIQCKSPKVKGLAVQVHVFSQAQALWLAGKSIFSNTRHNSSKLNLTKICLMRQRFFLTTGWLRPSKKWNIFGMTSSIPKFMWFAFHLVRFESLRTPISKIVIHFHEIISVFETGSVNHFDFDGLRF